MKKKIFWISALAVLLSAVTFTIFAVHAKVDEDAYDEDDTDDIDNEIVVESKDWPQTKLSIYIGSFLYSRFLISI